MPSKKDTPKKQKKTGTKKAAGKKMQIKSMKKTPQKFPLVGLGASAGGLEALKAFFSDVPDDSGMAFIVVVHMAPKQPSMMPELLQRETSIPVTKAEDGETIKQNHVYVIPPNKEITVYKDKIQLLDMLEGQHHPIDSFFRSLAQDQGENAVAIVLSGTGSDGTLGIKEIKSCEGLVVVQSEDSASYDGMLRSAIGTGLVDIIAPPKKMVSKLYQYFKYEKLSSEVVTTTTTTTTGEQQAWLNKIFAILRTHVGHDFSGYKVNTLLRRIGRRMGLNQIKDHENYVRYLRENPSEVKALFRELLIGVTNFFRDAESFNVLKNDILPKYFDQMKEGEAFRAWIPGCSTGEEVYSLAIILRECLGTNPKGINLQLFGTDIDTLAVDKAREGLYPKSISADVSPERLKRFFVEEGELYRISKEIRDSAVFSVQDVIKDPPFSRLSLLCCRNLLIYLDTEAQKKLIPLFHYTLTADGILVLGSSETVGGYSNLFKTLDKKWKIFRRQEVPRSLYQQIEFPVGESTPQGIIDTNLAAVGHKSNIGSLVQKAVLDELGTTALLVDGKGNILHVQGRTGKYLETPSGPPTQNILDMAREGLRIELSSALRAAKSSNEKVVRRRISVKTNGDVQLIDLHVSPQYAPKELAGRFLVAFEDVENTLPASDQPQDKQGVTKEAKGRIAVLEKELQNTRESHQTTIEELESSNEELKSTNEELQSSNEELQSTNEELESSKEELQSLNEELQTVNSELQSKVEELSSANDDMRNLLNSTEIATIFVDNDMRVRRFTKEATAIINLIETDIGRPLQHVVTNLTYERMIDDLEIVLKNLTPKEIEVQTAEGRWYNMRIVPYRTTDNRIDGAVLTFAYIGDQKAAQELLEKGKDEMSDAWQLLRSVFDMDENLMAVLNKDNKLVVANNNFCELLDIHKDKVFGLDMLAVQDSVLDKAGLGKLLTKSMKANKAFETEACELSISGKKTKIVFKGQVIKRKNVSDYVLLKGIKEGGKGGGNG